MSIHPPNDLTLENLYLFHNQFRINIYMKLINLIIKLPLNAMLVENFI